MCKLTPLEYMQPKQLDTSSKCSVQEPAAKGATYQAKSQENNFLSLRECRFLQHGGAQKWEVGVYMLS